MATISLGRYSFPVNPESISWQYTVRKREFQTLAGRVLQILGCSIDEISMSGKFASRKQMEDFKRFVIDTMESKSPVLFKYPARNWTAKVRIASLPSVKYDPAEAAPKYGIRLIVDDGLQELARATADSVLRSMLDGVLWEPSEYNDYTIMPQEIQVQMEESLKKAYAEQSEYAPLAGVSPSVEAGPTTVQPQPSKSTSVNVGDAFAFDAKKGISLNIVREGQMVIS